MKKLVFIALFILPVSALAGSYYFNPRLQTQVRENALSEREVPFDAFLDAGLSELPQSGTLDVSLKNNRTFKIKEDEFDLYQAVYRMKDVGGAVDLSAGRQFISPGFHAYLVDGLETKIGKDDWPVLFGAFGGVPRYIETGDFHGKAGLVSGVTAELQGVTSLFMKLSAVYDKLVLDTKDWKENETILVGLNSSYQFHVKLDPNIYGSLEYDTASKTAETGIVGLRLKLNNRLYWNAEGGHYDTNRSRNRSTILGLYTSGRMYQGRTGAELTLVENAGAFENVVLNGGYSYQRFKISSTTSENGHVADVGIRFSVVPISLDTGLTYRFYDSFGGRANDVLLTLHDEPFDKFFIDTGANYTKYSKITNEDDSAVSGFLSAGYEVAKGLQLSAGGEYLRNNTFSKEFRALVKLAYALEGKI